jgi:hypothetical protein
MKGFLVYLMKNGGAWKTDGDPMVDGDEAKGFP